MLTQPPLWIRRVEDWLWQQEGQKHGAWRLLWHACRILFAVIRDVSTGHITLHAMSLVYTTLLSVVPLLALSFSVLKALGVHNQLEPLLHNLMAPLGEQGSEIVANVLGFVDNIKVGVLGWLGLGLLIFTVISLIQKVERSFNEIWRVTQIRPIGQRFSSYLSVIVIGPVLVVSTIGTTATLVGSDWVKDLLTIQPFGWLFSLISRLTPYFMIISLFTFVYLFIPNTRVKLRYALVGGVTAGIAWQSAIYGFTRFVVNSNYEAIYSGFAVGILLLIWLYVAWLILLMGASVAFYAQHATQIRRERLITPCAQRDERLGLGIVYQVARQFDGSGGALAISALEQAHALDPESLQRLMDRLIRGGILVAAGSDGDALAPARSLDRLSLADVLRVIRAPGRQDERVGESDRVPRETSAAIDALLERQFESLSLQTWVRQQTP